MFHLIGWFSNRTGTSVDDCVSKSSNWLAWSMAEPKIVHRKSSLVSSARFPVLSINQPNLIHVYFLRYFQKPFQLTHSSKAFQYSLRDKSPVPTVQSKSRFPDWLALPFPCRMSYWVRSEQYLPVQPIIIARCGSCKLALQFSIKLARSSCGKLR